MKKQKNNWRVTIKNKIFAMLFILVSLIPLFVYRDGTYTVFALFLAIPLFFAKKNYIM